MSQLRAEEKLTIAEYSKLRMVICLLNERVVVQTGENLNIPDLDVEVTSLLALIRYLTQDLAKLYSSASLASVGSVIPQPNWTH